MTTPRADLVAALRAELPGWSVIGSPRVPDSVTRPTVLVWAEQLDRGATVGHVATVRLVLWVLTGLDAPKLAETELDESLADVLGALQPLEWVEWTTADRAVLAETWQGWRVALVAAAIIT